MVINHLLTGMILQVGIIGQHVIFVGRFWGIKLLIHMAFQVQGKLLGGGNSNIFYLQPYLGKIPIFDSYFSIGLKPQTRNTFVLMIINAVDGRNLVPPGIYKTLEMIG